MSSGKYDEIILANGVIPRQIEIDGINHPKVLSYTDVLSKKESVGNTIAIIGAGGIGFDVAEYLLHSDHSNKIVEIETFLSSWGVDTQYLNPGGLTDQILRLPSRQIYLLKRSPGKHGTSLGKTTGWIHKTSLLNHGVQMIADVKYLKIDDVGLHIEVKGEQKVLIVDHIIICAGQQSSRELYNELIQLDLYPHLIGGANEAVELDAKRAIHQACCLAANI
ncbi:MAG: FAD-dependent oxidoreductase [Saprospiraceae bacterium]|nr:FAD-dependent oxidoreductase [Saprospiraceae bacterium]